MFPRMRVPGWTVGMWVVAALVSGCVTEPGIDLGVLETQVAGLERARADDRVAIAAILRREEESRGQGAEILRRMERLDLAGVETQVALADLRESLAYQRVETQDRERKLLAKRIESLDRWIETLEAEKAAIQAMLGPPEEPPPGERAKPHQP